MENSTTKSALRRDLERLRGLADELRVQIQLAGMEVRQAWDELEPKLRQAEQRAQRALDTIGEGVATEVIDAASVASQLLEGLRTRLTVKS